MNLTTKEQQVADLIVKGLTNEQISETLSLKVPTVKYRITEIYKKCAVKSRAQFLVKALTKEVGG